MSSQLPAFAKTATAKRDYTLDWATLHAPGDNLSGVVWTVPGALTNVASGVTGGLGTIRLSGGTLDQTYLVRGKGTRASGRVDTRSFQIVIVPRVIFLVATKDPTAVADYTLDASDLFGGDPPSTYAWTASGISISGATNAATVWLTGGVAGTTAYANCHVVSASGQEDDRSIELTIQDL